MQVPGIVWELTRFKGVLGEGKGVWGWGEWGVETGRPMIKCAELAMCLKVMIMKNFGRGPWFLLLHPVLSVLKCIFFSSLSSPPKKISINELLWLRIWCQWQFHSNTYKANKTGLGTSNKKLLCSGYRNCYTYRYHFHCRKIYFLI